MVLWGQSLKAGSRWEESVPDSRRERSKPAPPPAAAADEEDELQRIKRKVSVNRVSNTERVSTSWGVEAALL